MHGRYDQAASWAKTAGHDDFYKSYMLFVDERLSATEVV
jgi:hypothetical protein